VNSLILQVAGKFLFVLMLLFSIFLLIRGHNEPGGGFVGGLMAVGGFGLYSLAYGVDEARRALRLDPRTVLGLGLVLAFLSGLPAALMGQPFLTGLWLEFSLGQYIDIKVGTPTLFDVGVFLVVVGGTLAMIYGLEEE
jgi:multicomponent Na+:H+ antiporter subunit B